MSVALAVYMGGSCLANGADDPIGSRARRAAIAGGLAALVIFTVAGFWVSAMEGFKLVAGPDPGVPQTPATVSTTPSLMRRMQWFSVSAISTRPRRSSDTYLGPAKRASRPGPPRRPPAMKAPRRPPAMKAQPARWDRRRRRER